MKNSDFLFKSFLLVLLFYFWRNIRFWMSSQVFDVEDHDILIYVSIAIIWCFSFFYIISYRRLVGQNIIHKISLAWFICMAVVLPYNDSPLSAYFKCLLWPLLFEVTYICSILYRDSQRQYCRLFYLLAIMGGVYFFESLVVYGYESASNIIYFVILTIPFILATQTNSRLNIFILILASFLALVSLKRSMMLAVILYWTVYFLVYMIKRRKIIQSVILVILMSVIAINSYYYIDDMSGGNISKRMEKEDVTNGREAIYEITMLMITNSSIDHKILGNGQNAVKRDSLLDISAHNEWLEVIYDYGYIALSIYILLWIYMIRKWWYLYKKDSPYYQSMTLCLCIWAVMSMVSQLLVYVSYVIYLFMYLAYMEAKTREKLSK